MHLNLLPLLLNKLLRYSGNVFLVSRVDILTDYSLRIPTYRDSR